MTTTEGRLVQVVLTGKRLAQSSNEELIARIRAKFKLSEVQAAAMVKGRCVVKRDVDAAVAGKFVAALRELGLDAIVAEMPEAEHPLPQTSTPAKARPNPAVPLAALQALANQRLPRPPTAFLYLLGLLAVTLLCVALPALYIGLTGAIAFGWFWYLTHIHHYLPRSIHAVVLMYAAPGLAGAVLVLFLARPLFARRPRPKEALKLDPQKEAGFVAGVHALCRAIGVSPPVEIRLSWDANASVHFRTRWLSLLTGHKVLTIGLSMVAGLSARQFVGVLAHEFGHFAQRFGMMCTFVVNSVNGWLEHCAYGDDAWERKLSEWSEEAGENWYSWLIDLSVWITWFALRGARHLMAGLFHLSLRLSAYMSRQMEFDADRYEALLAGSQMFRTTARSLRALNHAMAEVNRANIEAWREHKLLRDLPEAVAVHASAFDAARLAQIEEEMSDGTLARYWDSHPPDAARIENAEKRNAPGIYLEEVSATQLFSDFAAWSQRATREFYTDQEVSFADGQLHSADEILGHVRNRNQRREQLTKFFNGQFQDWPLFQAGVSSSSEAAQPGWQECIDGIRSRSPDITRHWSNAMQAHERRALLRTAVSLRASSRDVGLPGPVRSAEDLGGELERIASSRMDFHRPLEEAFRLYAMRIQHAIDAMQGPEHDQAINKRDTLAAMAALEQDAGALEELAGAMRAYGAIAESSGSMPAGIEQLESRFAEVASQLLARADRIPQVVTADQTVGGYLRARCRGLPLAGTVVAPDTLVRAAWGVANAFHHLYLLALGELVNLCEAAEKKQGIRPIRLVA